MSRVSHTEGEWQAKGAAVYAGGSCIALCDTDNATPETFYANARLMAAAPELLAALKNHVHWHEPTNTDKALKAIAKAEGGS